MYIANIFAQENLHLPGKKHNAATFLLREDSSSGVGCSFGTTALDRRP